MGRRLVWDPECMNKPRRIDVRRPGSMLRLVALILRTYCELTWVHNEHHDKGPLLGDPSNHRFEVS